MLFKSLYLYPDLVSATIRIPPESMQYLIGVDNDITLSCDWNESAFYLAWFKNRLPIYAIDLISKKVELNSTPFMFDLPASGIRRLNMSIQNGFLNDSGNYTCAVSCKAREAVNGEMDRTAILETYGDTREILFLGIYIYIMYSIHVCMYIWLLYCYCYHGDSYTCGVAYVHMNV